MKHVLLLLAFLITGAISQSVYAYQDKVCHVMTSDSIRLHFPNAIVLGADCGHMVFLEEPAVFAEALDRFCQLFLK